MTTLREVVLRDARTDVLIDLGHHSGLLVAIRHHGWLPCQEHLVQVQQLGVPAIAVGFDPAPELARVADRIGWRGPFLADPDRAVYRRLGLRRAPWWRIWSPRTLLFYARRERSTAESGHPTDLRQMGGDAVVVDGVVVRCWRPRTPVDRVAPAALRAAIPQ